MRLPSTPESTMPVQEKSLRKHGYGPLDARNLRSILGSFATGVTIVTTLNERDEPVGVTANSFSSVSLDPPLVSWCLRDNSQSLPAFRRSQRFAINILGAADLGLCKRFAKADPHKWRDVSHLAGENGCPVLAEAIAVIECRLVAEHKAGDHVILIGQVDQARADEMPPLVFYRGRFYGLEDAGAVRAGKDSASR